MRSRPRKAEHGLAMPVMLIILAVMLMSSIYLLKSSNSTTLTTANLAYDAAQARAVDYGLMQGYEWLKQNAAVAAAFDGHSGDNGFRAFMPKGEDASTRSAGFWSGSRKIQFDNQDVEYVIHRMCETGGPTDVNKCVLTADNPLAKGSIRPGDSVAIDAPRYLRPPKWHFLLTARITGARGGNVVSQMVVQIGP